MSDKKKKIKKKNKIIPIEIDANVSFTNESIAQNASIESTSSVIITDDVLDDILTIKDSSFTGIDNGDGTFGIKEIINFQKEYKLSDYYQGKPLSFLTLPKLQEFQDKNGVSTEQTYNYLKSEVLKNKDNPEELNSLVSHLLNSIADHYDNSKSHAGVADSQLEVFDKLLNTSEDSEVKGLICGPIHEFMMTLLQDCGINAVLLAGTSVGGGGHITMMYQRPDGKYVFNDYGQSMVLNASNILDAISEVSKNSATFEGNGYLTLKDGKTTYQKFAYRKENVFGEEMDKADYNNQSPFNHSISQNSSVRANLEVSNQGNVSAQAGETIVYGNSSRKCETSLEFGYKKNGETNMFHSSQSIGAKVEHKQIKTTENGKNFFEVKGIVSYIQGNVGSQSYTDYYLKDVNNANIARNEEINADLKENNIEEITYNLPSDVIDYNASKIKSFALFTRASLGKEHTLAENDKLKLSNVSQVSIIAGGVVDPSNEFSCHGDFRLALEEGISITNIGKYFEINNNLSAGLIGDLKSGHIGLGIGIQPGVKVNAGTSLKTTPSENLTFGAKVNAYSVISRPSSSYGLSAQVDAEYKPKGSKVSVFTKAGFSIDREQLSLGGFNERVEDKTTFSALIGANLNDKVSLNSGYKQEINHLNKTKNNSTFNVGAVVKF